MKNKIEDQYILLKVLNQNHSAEALKMRRIYRNEVKIYEGLQSQILKEEIDRIILVAKKLFPDYIIEPTQFGIKISCQKGISGDGENAKNENSGLGDYAHGQEIYKTLVDKLGHIIKTHRENIAWFNPKKNSDYNDKTSWVYTSIEYEFKKTYLNKEFNMKTAPLSKI
jgi:hypothetical protein